MHNHGVYACIGQISSIDTSVLFFVSKALFISVSSRIP